MNDTLISLAIIFSQLSLLAFGGGNTILPEMQRQVVEVHHWMPASEFSALFALAQAAPGPNLMVVTLVGWPVVDCDDSRAQGMGTLQGSAVAALRASGAGTGDRGAGGRECGADRACVGYDDDRVGDYGSVCGAGEQDAHSSVVAARRRQLDRADRDRAVLGSCVSARTRTAYASATVPA
jgi:hypothetical protein